MLLYRETHDLPALPFPIDRVDKRHGDRYILEVVTRVPHGIFTTHAWIRLYDPYGRMISVGFFGQRPITGIRQFLHHMIPRKGKVTVPDMYELVTPEEEVIATPIEISSEEYWILLDSVCQLKEEKACQFHVFDLFLGTNCAGFVNQLTRKIGIPVGASWLNMPYYILKWQNSVRHWRESQSELRQYLLPKRKGS